MNEPTRLQADKVVEMVERLPVCHLKGKISQAIGLTLEATGPRLSLAELCTFALIMAPTSMCRQK